ncbi:hypothetical protein M758_8G095400 [Ceratodon purpureus]|uniref:Calcineurin-like phosphoesterase domain-containing protein n=1 Tax=Ceratodon purpureus TaxID=3225 RepID=A0A8T0GZ11_CERPU|nr:hypothetical protein KC19_8G099600 [Ceratodon purpureus]KAG0564300.1 hypothetical protein KC19_8G099600 [Ceratodon purpureus]KAG0608305.1 hypothetical protein M758_8G095400 [Ceratodon purpureus]
MHKRWKVAAVMGCLWAASLMYGEVLSYWVPVVACPWPSLASSASGVGDGSTDVIRIAVIADPQLTDRTSYNQKPGSLALRLTQFYSDIYMRRAFRSSVLGKKPDQIIFLGDLLDGGPILAPEDWQESLKRYEHIFDQSEGGVEPGRQKPSIPVYTLPGNHDLGYEAMESANTEAVERYRRVFGPLEHNVTIGGVEFVFVDAQALDGSGGIATRSWNFVKQKAIEKNNHVRVLVTHMPLFRPDDTPCGRDRASPVINQRMNYQPYQPFHITYQNYVTEKSSSKLLNNLKPVMVLSGHDHDQCFILHKSKQGYVPEHTLGTFSWQQGNHFPSFMLLTVSSNASKGASREDVVASRLCWLPVQIAIYIWYGVLLVITLLALMLWPSQGIAVNWFVEQTKSVAAELFKSQKVKLKDEDVEWEMIWDAEGGMHLLNKGPKVVPPLVESTGTPPKRGNVARRAGHDLSMDSVVKMPTVSSPMSQSPSTFMRRVRIRTIPFSAKVFQTLSPVVVLATLNFSFYVLLLMKDWGPL